MNFKNIAGQNEVITSLKKSIVNKRVGHAYIFSGPEGIGKKTAAMAFAAAVLCQDVNLSGNCGQCMACRLMSSGTNPDLHIIDPGTGSIGIDLIRDIQSDIIIKPLYSPRKVYIITSADKMTAAAQNCLLKTLEEPPAYSVFILTTAVAEGLKETIRSRAVKYNFKKNTLEEVKGVLVEKYGNIPDIDFAAAYSDGVIGKAIEIIESKSFISLREKTIEMITRLITARLSEVFELYSFFGENKDDASVVFDIMQSFYRDILVVKTTEKEKKLINSDKKDIILGNAVNFSVPRLLKSLEAIESARKYIMQNANFQLSIEVMLMTLQEEEV